MKDVRIDNTDFETFLQSSTAHVKMSPSDRIWQNLHSQLHRRKRWPELVIIGALIFVLHICGTLILHPKNSSLREPFLLHSNDNKKAVISLIGNGHLTSILRSNLIQK